MSELEQILPKKMLKEGFTYFFYFEYYPVRYEVSKELQDNRQIIWYFKDGRLGDDFHKSIAEDFEYLNLGQHSSNWWICAIPASTKLKTENRFMRFCEIYSKEASVNNGYSLITSNHDREAKHLKDDRNSVDLLDSISFNSISGKRILLFDDIYTTGKSFLKVARKLKSLGAIDVVGLFLGKTHWLEENCY